MRDLIHRNAKAVSDFHDRIQQAFAQRSKNDKSWEEWKKACAEFHSRYDSLAFPGGYEQGLRKLAENDPSTIETALCFLEVHPSFFHSQYISTKLKRILKRAPLSRSQTARLNNVLSRKPKRKRFVW